MKSNRVWALQSFLTCFFFNSALAVLIYFMSDKILAGISEMILPFLKTGAAASPEEMHSAIGLMAVFLSELHTYLAPALAAITGAATLLLWLCIFFIGRSVIARKDEPGI